MVSIHFSDEELVVTDSGLDNVIPATLIPGATRHAETLLEPLRVLLGPLQVNSWYRSPAVNAACGGEPTSYHLLGLATDVVPNGDVFAAFKMAVTQLNVLPIDQIIFEHRNSDWIHIGSAKDGAVPRHMALTSHKGDNGKMVYSRYDPE